MAKALLLNYRWCTGCHSCEVACKAKNDLTEEQYGIKLEQVGPFQKANGTWEYTYFPLLTHQCNLCADRMAEGKLPMCVQTCQANCIQILDAVDAAAIAASNPSMLMMTL